MDRQAFAESERERVKGIGGVLRVGFHEYYGFMVIDILLFSEPNISWLFVSNTK